MAKFFGAPVFGSLALLIAYAKTEKNKPKDGLWFEIAMGGVFLLVMFMSGAIAGYVFRRGQDGSDVPDPNPGKLSDARTQSGKSAKLSALGPIEKEVLDHACSFLKDMEEVDKVHKGIEAALEKKGFKMPRTFWADPNAFLAWLGSKAVGVSVDEKAYRASWDRGLPREKKKEKKKSAMEENTAALNRSAAAMEKASSQT